ncbi:hypothetical protein D3C76_1268220 [compost metagenome]
MGIGRVEIALGLQDQLAEFAGCTFTATGLGNPVGVLADKGCGIGHCHAQADAADHRQVGQVVAQIGNLFIA